MKILVTGYNGQLGYDVVREGKERSFNIIGTTRENLNITNEKEVAKYIDLYRPDAIIHCAAYTAVDKAEDDKETCFDVNVKGTQYLAESAKRIGAKFMYISTDYVFEGAGTNAFLETDSLNPLGYYGSTKKEGEKIVHSLLDEWFIVRISWVFGMNGNNFVKTMLKLAETKKELNVVGDQVGSPTYTFDLARLLIDMIKTEKYGIYHASNEGFCSWSEFAEKIFKLSNKEVIVNAISTEEYPTRAKRPKNSRMSKQKIIENGFNPLPRWEEGLDHFLKVLKEEVK